MEILDQAEIDALLCQVSPPESQSASESSPAAGSTCTTRTAASEDMIPFSWLEKLPTEDAARLLPRTVARIAAIALASVSPAAAARILRAMSAKDREVLLRSMSTRMRQPSPAFS